MKIIDFMKKGNVVRFFLGEDALQEYGGDDWDDAPYDCNAGRVFDEYVSGYRDVAFDFDAIVCEPCNGFYNSPCPYTKKDMMDRAVPCIIVVPKEIAESSWHGEEFPYWVGHAGVRKYYFGDKMEPEKAVVKDDA